MITSYNILSSKITPFSFLVKKKQYPPPSLYRKRGISPLGKLSPRGLNVKKIVPEQGQRCGRAGRGALRGRPGDRSRQTTHPPSSRGTFECSVMHVKHTHGQLDASSPCAPPLNALSWASGIHMIKSTHPLERNLKISRHAHQDHTWPPRRILLARHLWMPRHAHTRTTRRTSPHAPLLKTPSCTSSTHMDNSTYPPLRAIPMNALSSLYGLPWPIRRTPTSCVTYASSAMHDRHTYRRLEVPPPPRARHL